MVWVGRASGSLFLSVVPVMPKDWKEMSTPWENSGLQNWLGDTRRGELQYNEEKMDPESD